MLAAASAPARPQTVWTASSLGRSLWAQVAVITLGVALFLLVLQPRIGVRDGDAYAYVVGAYSMATGQGFRELADGAPLNHWPPGYSALLSIFPDPLTAAVLINYASAGLAAGLVFALARRAGWAWPAAAGWSVVLGTGLFRSFATNASPDALTYALFLLAVYLAQLEARRWMAVSYAIWCGLIPFKLIAEAFTPAAIVVQTLLGRRSLAPRDLVQQAFGAALWVCAVGGVVLFNLVTIGTLLPDTHEASTPETVFRALVEFASGAGRDFVAYWYGSLRGSGLVAFAAMLACGAFCFVSLRPHPAGRRLLVLGTAVVGMSLLMQFVRSFEGSPRLMGYGLVLLVLGLRPLPQHSWRWMAYGLVGIIVAVINVVTVNSLGANDPRYAALAKQFASAIPSDARVFSNSFHLLDIHARRASISVDTSPTPGGPNDYFLWVALPQYDGIASSVSVMPRPSAGWCELQSSDAATLFRACP